MKPHYWHVQPPNKPLSPELEWSRPENRLHAGKLLVVGGNVHGFAAPAEAFAEADRAGAGTVRALLPDAIQKIVGVIIPDADFAPSTRASGSFAQKALDLLLANAAWADGVLIAGDLGRNSETAIVLEKFLTKFHGPVTLTKDAADYAASLPHAVQHRPDTTLVLSLSQLQRLGTACRHPQAIAFSMDMLRLVEWLHDFTAQGPNIIVKHLDTMFVAVNGEVSTTTVSASTTPWRVATAARASVWWMQNPSKPFAALTTAVLQTKKD